MRATILVMKFLAMPVAAASAILFSGLTKAAEAPPAFETHPGSVMVTTDWADGDSFQVKLANGRVEVIRLYGADCFETDAKDESLARRLREQRAHFGFRSMADAVRFGLEAKEFTAKALAKPFTVRTRWERAPGRAGLPRFYAFVTTAEGKDLAADLVSLGLARAHGVTRATAGGASADEYAAHLTDLEEVAALKRVGAWRLCDPDGLPEQRREFREEERRIESEQKEVAEVKKETLRVDPNNAGPEELDRLPGVGTKLAQRILQGRPYSKPEDLLNVEGIGPKQLAAMRPFLEFRTGK